MERENARGGDRVELTIGGYCLLLLIMGRAYEMQVEGTKTPSSSRSHLILLFAGAESPPFFFPAMPCGIIWYLWYSHDMR